MKYVFIAATLLLLTACEHQIPPAPTPIHYTSAPYVINVASINVASDYTSTRQPPNVEYLFSPTPAKSVRDWVTSRLVARGQAGSLEVDIRDASVVKKDIPKQETGISGFFTKEQTEEYNGTLDVTLKIYNGRKVLPVATAQATVHQTMTLREDATLEDRKALYNTMTINLMNALDAELDKNIRQYFTNYLL